MRRRAGGKAFRSMRWRTLLPLLLLVVVGAALSPSLARAVGPPVITDVVPETGLAGAVVSIVGYDFTGATSVTFGGRTARFAFLNDGNIQATSPVPARAGVVDIVVTTPEGSSSDSAADNFTYVVPSLTIAQGNGLSVSEEGESDSYTVKLSRLPTGTVTIRIPDTDDLEITPNTLVFTMTNYSRAQVVTVSAVDDVNFEQTHTAVILHRASGGGYGAAGGHPVSVRVTDNDRFMIIVSQSAGSTHVIEGGRPDFLSLRLNSDPAAEATVTITADDQLVTSASTFKFTRANWGSLVEFAVFAVDDDLMEGDHTGTLTFTLSGASRPAPVAELIISISDEHSPALRITESDGATAVAEAGGQDTYTIVLPRRPASAVTVAIRPEEGLRASPTQVVFSRTDWDQPRTVTVEAVDDDLSEGEHVHHIHHVATGGGLDEFAAVLLGVTITDDDTPDYAPLPLAAGFTLVGWFGAPTTARAILDGNPALTRIWIWDQSNGWRGDSRAFPPGLRRDIPIARGDGFWLFASEPTTLNVPLP